MNGQEPQPRFKWKPTLVIFVVAISGLIIVNYSLPFLLNSTDHHLTNKITLANITITVNFSNKTTQTKSNIFSRVTNATVFDVTNESFQITYLTFPNLKGYFIDRIEGDNNGGAGWIYAVNGTVYPIACSLYYLSNNSVVEWRRPG